MPDFERLPCSLSKSVLCANHCLGPCGPITARSRISFVFSEGDASHSQKDHENPLPRLCLSSGMNSSLCKYRCLRALLTREVLCCAHQVLILVNLIPRGSNLNLNLIWLAPDFVLLVTLKVNLDPLVPNLHYHY